MDQGVVQGNHMNRALGKDIGAADCMDMVGIAANYTHYFAVGMWLVRVENSC